MRYIYTLLVTLAFTLSSCEKDDICSGETSTTPRLVIECYNVANLTQLKTVSNLAIRVNGATETINFNGVSKIYLPFDTTQETVQFECIQNGTDEDATNDNTDLITLNYTRNMEYVSRACGYKMNFALNNPNGFTFSDAPSNDGLWIQTMGVIQTTITNENEVHVKLFF